MRCSGKNLRLTAANAAGLPGPAAPLEPAYNLTAVRDPAQMVSRHLLDSLSVLPWLGAECPHLLDAGTGAGLPGIPLAIVRPGMQVTLLDSAGKKIRFLRHVKRELGLDNVLPVQQRLEEYSPPELPSVIISRAFSELAQFAAAARHLLRPAYQIAGHERMLSGCRNRAFAGLDSGGPRRKTFPSGIA